MLTVEAEAFKLHLVYDVHSKKEAIFGLKYRPSLEPGRSDDIDFYGEFYRDVAPEFSAPNRAVLKQYLLRAPHLCCVVEIGVQRNPLPESSTAASFTAQAPPGRH